MAMPNRSGTWINFVAGVLGGFLLGMGVAGLARGFSMWDSFLAVLGFLIAGWAVLDYRRYRRGTPESEVEGGHTIE